MIEPVDLGICRGYEYQGDPTRTALVLPGRMLAGMPINAFAINAVWQQGWRAILVWDALDERTDDMTEWIGVRLNAAAAYAGDEGERLVIGKSLGTLAAGLAERLRRLAALLALPLQHLQLLLVGERPLEILLGGLQAREDEAQRVAARGVARQHRLAHLLLQPDDQAHSSTSAIATAAGTSSRDAGPPPRMCQCR